MRSAWLAALLLLTTAATVSAHDLHHSVESGSAVIVTLSYGDGAAFSFEAFELFRPGEDTPFSVGRTDALGRVVFVPDVYGDWRLRAFSEDGHGVDVTVAATVAGVVVSTPPSGRSRQIVTGLSVLFGVFGLIALFYRRKT
jgi:nickel transport protein